MSDRSLVLVVSNDLSLTATKTSRHLCQALNQLGRGAIGRDTRLIRWAASEVKMESPVRREAYESGVVAKWNKFIFDYGFDAVISLDLHWLFSSRVFVENEKVKQIHSIWFEDLGSDLQKSPRFSLASQSPLDLINAPKVSHHCHGRGQAEELRFFGVKRVLSSALAAPAEYLEAAAPCTEMKKLAFVGGPGPGVAPTRAAITAMERGENLAALRRLARQEILAELSGQELKASWVRQCPAVADLLAAATGARLVKPGSAAVSLLAQAGQAYPDALEFFTRKGLMTDAAMLVKSVNRYDRSGLVHRLWRRGWLDVYGPADEWADYGITAQPTVSFPEMASIYRRHPAFLNHASYTRDAMANEDLYEIAACARLSLNLESTEARACYSDEEVIFADSDEALESAAEKVLRDPSAALARGERARQRTAKEHLWEHRLKRMLA
jgi:hypothetical protein